MHAHALRQGRPCVCAPASRIRDFDVSGDSVILKLMALFSMLLPSVWLLRWLVPQRAAVYLVLSILFAIAYSYLAFVRVPPVTNELYSLYTIQWVVFGLALYSVLTLRRFYRDRDA